METYVILRREGWRTADDLREAAARSAAEGERMSDDVRWIRSYVTATERYGRHGLRLPGVEPGGDPAPCERRRPAGRRDRQGRRHRDRPARPCRSCCLKGKTMGRGLIAAFVALPLLAVAGFAAGGGQSSLADLREATAKYHDIEVARALHDEVELPQVPSAPAPASRTSPATAQWGSTWSLQDRVDGTLVPTEPEALLYEKRHDGSYKLTGVEYIVAAALARRSTARSSTRPTWRRYGNPAADVWTLHAWIWKPNPDPDRDLRPVEHARHLRLMGAT